MTTNLEERAKRAAAERLRQVNGDAIWRSPRYPDHLENWWDNLLEGVTRADCEEDLGTGAGAETRDRKHRSGVTMPAKFCAPHSSSALAVNTFGPFRHQTAYLRLKGHTGFTNARFEYPCDNGLRTQYLPHFDFFADSPDGVIAVESKFLEPLGNHKVEFKPLYDGPFRGSGGRAIEVEEPWRAVFEALKSGALRYKHLDAAQLVKHYLGLIHNFGERPRALLYLFWEPDDLSRTPEFAKHRNEAEDFAKRVEDCDTCFTLASYAELWHDWGTTSTWPGMPAHVARLRERYSFSI